MGFQKLSSWIIQRITLTPIETVHLIMGGSIIPETQFTAEFFCAINLWKKWNYTRNKLPEEQPRRTASPLQSDREVASYRPRPDPRTSCKWHSEKQRCWNYFFSLASLLHFKEKKRENFSMPARLTIFLGHLKLLSSEISGCCGTRDQVCPRKLYLRRTYTGVSLQIQCTLGHSQSILHIQQGVAGWRKNKVPLWQEAEGAWKLYTMSLRDNPPVPWENKHTSERLIPSKTTVW